MVTGILNASHDEAAGRVSYSALSGWADAAVANSDVMTHTTRAGITFMNFPEVLRFVVNDCAAEEETMRRG
jgi:hypothetical protein